MNEEQRKRRWERDTDKLYRAIGEFLVKFESVCDAIQRCIMGLLQQGGLRDQRVSQILLAGMTAEPLRTLYASLVAQTQTLTEDDRIISSNAVSRFQKLIEERNDIVHSTWFIGYGNEDTVDFSQAHGLKFHKNKNGLAIKSFGRKAEDFQVLSEEAQSLFDIFIRLYGCMLIGLPLEKNFHVSADGRVSVTQSIKTTPAAE